MGRHTKNGLIMFGLLIVTVFVLPHGIFEYDSIYFNLIVILYSASTFGILYYMSRSNTSDFEHQKIDYFIFDILYLGGLTMIVYLIAFLQEKVLWQAPIAEYAFLSVFSFFFIWRLLNIDTRHTGIIRFSYLMLCPAINAFIINQILTLWYGLNFLGQGFGR